MYQIIIKLLSFKLGCAIYQHIDVSSLISTDVGLFSPYWYLSNKYNWANINNHCLFPCCSLLEFFVGEGLVM